MKSNIKNTGSRAKKQRNYFPFSNGMRSQLFGGTGANYQLNLKQKDGFLEKVKQSELKIDSTFDSVDYISSYQKSDGSFQTLVFGFDGSDIKLRVIDSDGTLLTPTGGLGDLVFTGTVTARQDANTGIINSSLGSTNWDGTTLTANTGSLDIISSARDGSRIGYILADGTAHFSDSTPSDGFAGGTGANAGGDYDSGIRVASAIVEGGVGTVIFGEEGAEAHWVQPNNASDDVSTRTRIDSFNYRRNGVKNERFVTATGDSVAFMNEDGIFEMNPFSGQTTELTLGGKIERYWKEQIDQTNGFICYDPVENLILAHVALNSSQNNVWLVFNKKTKELEPFFIDNVFYGHAGIVGGALVGGESRNGNTYDLFSGFETSESTTSRSRFITEFDGLGTPQEEKTLRSFTGIVGVNPSASLKVRAYKDGETTSAFAEKTYTTTDLTTAFEGASYGEFVFSLGASDLVEEMVTRGEHCKANGRFKTIAIEIIEESSDNFEIYDIILEYKSSGRLSKSLSIKNNLF